MRHGAAGIVYGRNVIQHDGPDRGDDAAALMAIVHVAERVVRFGVIGGGLMGREFASAAARWVHLADLGVRPELVARLRHEPRRARAGTSGSTPRAAPRLPTTASCSPTTRSRRSTAPCRTTCTRSSTSPSSRRASTCSARSRSGSTSPRTRRSTRAIAAHPELLVRCSSELPFYPGGQEVVPLDRASGASAACSRCARSSSTRATSTRASRSTGSGIAALNGEYGCMGDLGMHALHLPLRAGLEAAQRARDPLATSSPSGPAPDGGPVAVRHVGQRRAPVRGERRRRPFPLRIETKRIAPGETNTWTIEIDGTEGSIAYTTKLPKTLRDDGLRARRAAGVAGRSTSARSRRTRRSPARSSSSASPTRSCRCGRRSSTSSPTAATGCGSRSTARRPRRRPRRHTAVHRGARVAARAKRRAARDVRAAVAPAPSAGVSDGPTQHLAMTPTLQVSSPAPGPWRCVANRTSLPCERRRGGRAVECGGLENRYRVSGSGVQIPPLRGDRAENRLTKRFLGSIARLLVGSLSPPDAAGTA